MDKRRISQRKSQLRLNIEDFCLGLPQNSDPIVGYLLTILQWQSSLDIQTNSILHKSFTNQIEQIKCKLKLELKHLKNKTQEFNSNQIYNGNISKHINQFHKIKQVFSYCLILSKKKSQLCVELQKFNDYRVGDCNLTEELENYMNQPVIFQTIFHSYLRAYNVNILTADLISFLYAQHQQKSHLKHNNLIPTPQTQTQTQTQVPYKWSNPQIQLLKNKTIIFKQLSDMSKKYLHLEQKLQRSYIYRLCHDLADISQPVQNSELKDEQDVMLQEKVKRLDRLLGKIKNGTSLCQTQKFGTIMIQNQPLSNLTALQLKNNPTSNKVIQQNKQFFLQTLYGKSWIETIIGDQQFTFMRQNIIRVQAQFFLNRILAGINILSYIYNQLDLQIRQNYLFQFKNLRKLIGCQFINKQTYTFQRCQSIHKSIFYSVDSTTKAFNVFDNLNNKILYPSAVNYFFCFIKTIMLTDFTCKQGLLQILQSKSQYIQSLAETIINIYQIIKIKQLSCYKLLREYIQIILKSSCWNHLGSYGNFEEIMRAVERQKQKIGIISQIISEFDHNYNIKQPLQELIRIQFDGLTKNCTDTFYLYKTILSEIIQIRNGLKLDHYYSVNQIHQNFSLIPQQDPDKTQQTQSPPPTYPNIPKQPQHQDLYFEDIIHEICQASHTNLYLPKLFFFFDLQLKLKRIVFKLQLCWSCNCQTMFDRKLQAFKEFINAYCTPVFQIVGQCHSIIDTLHRMEDLQRYTKIFEEQVARYHLVQKLVAIFTHYKRFLPNISITRQHINRLTLQNLSQLSTILNSFNPIQQSTISTKQTLITNLSKNIHNFSTIKISQLPNFNPIHTKQLQKLSSIIVLLHILQSRNNISDHNNIIKLYQGIQIKRDLYQLEQYVEIQKIYREWAGCKNQDKQELICYCQEVVVIAVLRTLRDMELEGIDVENSDQYKQIAKFMGNFALSRIFTSLASIEQIQFWRNQLGIMTRYHQIYQLMFHFDTFNTVVYGNTGKKAQYKDQKLLNQDNHKVDFNYQQSELINKLYYIFQISQLSKQKIQHNIQKLQQEILEVEPLHRRAAYYRTKLKNKIYVVFCSEITKILARTNQIQDIDINFDASKKPHEYIDMLRKKMLKAVVEYKNQAKKDGYGGFTEIEMFREKKGYELVILDGRDSREYKIGTKKYPDRNKKAVISPHRIQMQKVKPLQALKRKYKIEMLKKSIHIRKQISRLQLSQNKVREEITWQTSKLEHSVKQKINQFITLSNMDQHQSYLNFKHTVNLETIKGIENVIEQQTQMCMEKKKAVLDAKSEAFLTEVHEPEEEEQILERSKMLLDANVEAMIRHMKKIKIFSAWKKTMKKTDMTKKQWCNFNLNVQNILNNDKIVQSLNQIEEARNNYLKQNVACQIIKQQNLRVNERIQQLKLSNLQKKVKNYMEKLQR